MLRLNSALILMSLVFLTAPSVLAQVQWTASDQNPVFTIGEPGAWDSIDVFAYSLLKCGDEYKLWYDGSSSPDFVSADQVGCATSKDLISWKRCGEDNPWCTANPCLPGSPGKWDATTFNPYVVYRDDDPEDPEPYKMWYQGTRPSSIGFATSPNGCQWTKYEGNPVLRPTPGSWDSYHLSTPSVLFDKAKRIYRMWYAGHGSDICSSARIGYAESADGIEWTKHPDNPVLVPDATQAGVPWRERVLYDEGTGTFEMWYNFRCDVLSHNYATSLDGITWCKYPGNPLKIEGELLPAATGPVLRDGDLFHMIYNGEGQGFGYATSPWTLPRASFTVTPESGVAPLEITADAARSAVPPSQTIASYSWDFGDGTPGGEGVQVEHTYTSAGEFLLKLTVTDSAGEVGLVARKVVVPFPSQPVDLWTGEDIGTVAGPGGARPVGECLEVVGGVGAITGMADSFHFVHQTATGDFCLTAHVSDWNADLFTSSIGLMARASLAPGSPEASVLLERTSSGERSRFRTRLVENNSIQGSSSVSSKASDAWLRLERRADEFIASTFRDGAEWAELGRATIAMPQEIQVGAAAVDGRGPDVRDFAVGRVCNLELATTCERRTLFHRGDPNADGSTDISDGTSIFGFLFLGDAAPTCMESADTNSDGTVDISDGISLLNWLFLGGPKPAAPGPATAPCGLDPDMPGSPGDIGCESYGGCK